MEKRILEVLLEGNSGNINQEILDMLLEGYAVDFSKVLQFLDTLDNIGDLDLSKLEKDLAWSVIDNAGNLEIAYQYADKYNPGFRDIINNDVDQFSSESILTYLLINDVDEEEINKHIVKVFKGILYTDEKERELVQEFKKKMQKQDLFESTITKLKQSKNMHAIIPAALIYDNRLIEEIFDNKLNLYYYILDNLNEDAESIDSMMNYVASMNDGEVKEQIKQKAKQYEERIK